jgi:hypothetical protein
MKKAKFIGMIIGAVIGLLMAYGDTTDIHSLFWNATPVPFGMIGYAIGALRE